MSDEEVMDFLRAGRRTLSMGSIAPDGSIHLVAMWYGFAGDLVGVLTKAKSQKVHNLRRDPRVTILVEAGETVDELKGVELVGEAEIVDEPDDRSRALAASVLSRYTMLGTPPGEIPARAADASMYKRVAILVHPTRIVSWDHAKIPNGGYSSPG